MAETRVFPLDQIRTDGWFERIGDTLGSFQSLCEIIGEPFFAFSMITGARITALSVDRKTPENTIVDFVVEGSDEETPQKVTLKEFRQRLASALLTEEPIPPPPGHGGDTEALQFHIGVRYLLLAPLYGYSLDTLRVGAAGSVITASHDGTAMECPLEEFRARIRLHVREELERVEGKADGTSIDLSKVAEAETALNRGDFIRVIQLLGPWPAPLAIFLRTPEGQVIPDEVRKLISRGLGILGTACVRLGEVRQGEEVLRLAVQYAQDTPFAGDVYLRLGQAALESHRPGEAIGTLRRCVALGMQPAWHLLAKALMGRKRWVAAYAALAKAEETGSPKPSLEADRAAIQKQLGGALDAWQRAVSP